MTTAERELGLTNSHELTLVNEEHRNGNNSELLLLKKMICARHTPMLASNETMIQKRELDSQRKRTLIMKQKVLQQERRLRAKETEFEQIRNAQENARRLRRDREEFANLIQQQREAKLEECKKVKRAQQQKHYSSLDTPQRQERAREHAQEEYYKQMVLYNKKVQEINQINQKRSNERKRLLQLKSVLEQQDR